MQTLDCTDLKCPLPLLKLKVALADVAVGDRIELITTDAISCRDIPAFCDRAGHRLISASDEAPFRFEIEKST